MATALVDLLAVTREVRSALQGLLDQAQLRTGQIVVVGCSTSEILGRPIGKGSDLEAARAVLEALQPELSDRGMFLAVQCCQHLNRALVVEGACVERYDLEEVTVIPQPHAGGPLATLVYQSTRQPAVVERVAGHAGLDIGDTFIGMHLRPVVVPVRLPIETIGHAHLTLARTRPKLIGGERAIYPGEL